MKKGNEISLQNIDKVKEWLILNWKSKNWLKLLHEFKEKTLFNNCVRGTVL